jgi:low temperature requirement protein LtrA
VTDVARDTAIAEHSVTPLELFFDLAFVFGFTQVTRLLVDDPTWGGMLRGLLVLAALWWTWTGYAWLTSTTDVDDGGVRLAMLFSFATMLLVAVAVPGAFGQHALLFAVAYLVVRILHLVLYAVASRDDPDLLGSIVRFTPSELLGASLVVAAAFVDGDARVAVWIVALLIDYFGFLLVGLGTGWRIAPEHFAERHGLIVLIALGESVISIGAGAGLELVPKVLGTAALGVVVVSALWWLYFDVAAILARSRLVEATRTKQVALARDAYSYLHLPLVAGIVMFAFGLEETLHHVGDPLDGIHAVALCGGVALYLLGHVAFLLRATGRLFRRRTIGGVACVTLVPVALAVPAAAALALVAGACSFVVAYEAIAHREDRVAVRHPELAG